MAGIVTRFPALAADLFIALFVLSAPVVLMTAGCAGEPPSSGSGSTPDPLSADGDLGLSGQKSSPGLRVRVTGGEYKWLVRYAGEDGQLDTADDVLDSQHLHLPPDTRVTIDLRSEDYAYTFHLPEFDLLDVAMPDFPFILNLETDLPGGSALLGNQMCGFTHPELIGRVTVHETGEFEEWLAAHARAM